jgi:predicted adenine nucleotide alpha hydrolase (AANH) superfamily ATPase
MNKKSSVLLHICCGVCAISSIKNLQEKDFEVKGFYFNPNIYPQEEYFKRREVVEKLKKICDIEIFEGKYNYEEWKKSCVLNSDYEKETEGGKRCFLCYEYRLKETFKKMQELNLDYFTTTLTISPYKKSKIIFEIGKTVGGKNFLEIDFKKNDGFKKSVVFSKEYNFYRQNYCGCEFSLRI